MFRDREPYLIQINQRKEDNFRALVEAGYGNDELLGIILTPDEVNERIWKYYVPYLQSFQSAGKCDRTQRAAYSTNLSEFYAEFVLPLVRANKDYRTFKAIRFPYHELNGAVVMTGTFNGIPHPGHIEALCLVRNKFQGRRLIVGVETNQQIENVKHQVPDGSTNWRASLLAITGLIDGLFETNPRVYFDFNNSGEYGYPISHPAMSFVNSMDDYYTWHTRIYGKNSDYKPAVVIANGQDEVNRKTSYIDPEHTEIFDLANEKRIFADFHSSGLRDYEDFYSAKFVADSWQKLREAYLH